MYPYLSKYVFFVDTIKYTSTFLKSFYLSILLLKFINHYITGQFNSIIILSMLFYFFIQLCFFSLSLYLSN